VGAGEGGRGEGGGGEGGWEAVIAWWYGGVGVRGGVEGV